MNDTTPAPKVAPRGQDEAGIGIPDSATTATEPAWRPTRVGELFMLTMPNGRSVLQRVTAIHGPNEWTATSPELDEPMALHLPLPIHDPWNTEKGRTQ